MKVPTADSARDNPYRTPGARTPLRPDADERGAVSGPLISDIPASLAVVGSRGAIPPQQQQRQTAENRHCSDDSADHRRRQSATGLS